MQMHERIRIARESAGFSKADVAKALRVSRPTVGYWEGVDPNKMRRPSTEKLIKLSGMFGVEVEWFVNGRHRTDNVIKLPKDDVLMLMYIDDEQELFPHKHKPVSEFRRHLSEELLRGAKVDTLVRRSDASMSPLIQESAVYGLDTSSKDIRNGKIYTVKHLDMTRVATLYLFPQNRLRLRFENDDEYPEETIDDWKSQVEVIGQVTWVSQALS